MKREISIPFGEHTLRAVFSPHTGDARGCIFYLHGGGLVFGTSDDLPSVYETLFHTAGYDLIQLDYPLAPESTLTEITNAVHCSVTWLLSHPSACGYDIFPPYFLFGRSAGAFLALTESKRLCTAPAWEPAVLPKSPQEEAASLFSQIGSGSLPPAGILSFYGYHSFDLPEFHRPSAAYKKLPPVSEKTVRQLITDHFITDGPMSIRYSIYIYARQTGKWPEFLGTAEEIKRLSLTEEDFSLLPPGFFTASSGDQDVPFRESKQMAARIPGSRFFPVYYLEHDFDRDTSRKEGLQVYRAALDWMNTILPL